MTKLADLATIIYVAILGIFVCLGHLREKRGRERERVCVCVEDAQCVSKMGKTATCHCQEGRAPS